MKEPPLSRHRKPNNLKLIISFNGKFHLLPYTNKTRYVGGETRIVSLDRNNANFSFSNLRSKVSNLCPNSSSFSLKFQFPNSDESPLILIDSEEDFRSLIDEYDKFVSYDKLARLRVFVCRKSNVNYDDSDRKGNLGKGDSASRRGFPLNPRDGNLRLETRIECSKLRVNYSCVKFPYPGCNRENIVPWTTGDMVNNGCNVKSFSSVANVKYQTQRSYQNNEMEMGNCRGVGIDETFSIGKFDSGFVPILDFSKEGMFVRSYEYDAWRYESRLNGDLKFRKPVGPGDFDEFHLVCYDECVEVGDRFLEPCVVKSALPCLKVMENRVDVLNGIKSQAHEVPHLCEPSHFELQKAHGTIEPRIDAINHCYDNSKLPDGVAVVDSYCNLMTESCNLLCKPAPYVDILSHKLSLSSRKGVEVEPLSELSSCASEVLCEPLQKIQAKCRYLMGQEEVSDPLGLESNAVISTPSLQNVELQKGCVDEDVGITQDPKSTLYFDKNGEAQESEKCSEVIHGISSDLIASYSHPATRELQTIKNIDLEYIRELGSGAYGTVFYGKWKGSDVAIKKIKQSCFDDGLLEEDRLIADFWKEAHILGQLHHPNIVAFYGVVTDGPATNLATVAEYLVNGSLKQVLRRKDRTIDRRKRLIIAMDAAFGMEYLHEKNIVHFDLKSDNLLVNMRDPQRPICKIGDLGLSKIKQRTLVSASLRGTISWMAPELLNSNNNLVTEKVDVYSFGIVMWELLTGHEPYSNLRSEEIIAGLIKGDLRPEIPSWCDPSWRSLMQKCWSSDPDSRPPFSEVAKELRSMSEAMNIK